MATAQVECPACGGYFEVDAEYRGEEVDCPKCEAPFLIPLSGTMGELLEDVLEEDDALDASEETFEVACPHCDTVFVLPIDHRDAQAQCAECDRLFQIPAEGHRGLPVDDDLPDAEEEEAEEGAPELPVAQAVPAAPAGPHLVAPPSTPSPPDDGADSGTRAVPSLSSGLMPGGKASDAERSSTLRLSRNAVLQNTMVPQPRSRTVVPIQALPEGVKITPPRHQAEDDTPPPEPLAAAAGDETPPEGHAGGSRFHADGLPQRAASASGSVVRDRLGRRAKDPQKIPKWAPSIDLEQGEMIYEIEEADDPTTNAHVLLTGLPVFLIIPAPLLVRWLHPAAAMAVCFLPAVICWGVFLSRVLPRAWRRALILTSERAIMVNDKEVVDLELG